MSAQLSHTVKIELAGSAVFDFFLTLERINATITDNPMTMAEYVEEIWKAGQNTMIRIVTEIENEQAQC